MDKARDVRRVGASRFSPAKRQIIRQQSGLNDGGGDFVVLSEKSNKEKLRRLSVVGRLTSSNEDSEMGCVGSDVEDELRPTPSISKRFKFPKKFFDDCNTVDRASVPRKLRSAMKKRSSESASPPLPDSKKVKHMGNGVELLRKDGMKKSKPNMQKGNPESPRLAIAGPITKDEEEVVETLYALAGMFPDTDKAYSTRLDGKLPEAKSWALPGTESSMPAFDDSAVPKEEEDLKEISSIVVGEVANCSTNLEGSDGETVKVQLTTEASQHDLLNSKQLPVEFDNYVHQVNTPMTSLSSKTEPIIERSSCNSLVFTIPSELGIGTGSKQPTHEGTPASGRKPDIALGLVAVEGSQHGPQHTIKESKNNGSVMWAGLSSTATHAEMHGPSLQLSTTKLPAWLSNAICATQACSSNIAATAKDSRVPVDRKRLWKRSSAHVYISRLIKVLQITERKDRMSMQPTQLTPCEESKVGALAAVNKLNGERTGLNGVVSRNIQVCSAAEKNPNEVRNAILLHKRLLQDQQQSSTTSGLYSSQKQSSDFLSLSPGVCGVETNINRAGNGLESFAKFHLPYMQSLAQSHTKMPFSLPQNHYSSTPFPDHLSVAAAQQVQIQLPPYLGSTFCGPPHLGTPAQPKQQQQEQNWTSQLALHYKPGGVAGTHIPNWKNGGDSPSMIQHSQAIFAPSRSSLEVIGPKYAPILPQQKQLIAITSPLPPARVKRQNRHLPSGYEGSGGFHTDDALSLQLLCNEHL